MIPRCALLTCAGIIGIAAEPAENSNKLLEILIVAAHRSFL
jgi:glutamine amidotransferase PdxT